MIGQLNKNEKRVTIIGAGISGLLIGYALKKQGYQVKILEASSRVGGLIQTRQTPFGIVETAAHSLLVNPCVANLFSSLDLPLAMVDPKSKARYIVRDSKMRRMPLRIGELFQTLLRVFSKPNPAVDLDRATLERWGNAYLGPAATQYLLAPFITGVFACSPSDLSAKLAFPRLVPNSPSLSLWRHLKNLKKQSPQGRAKMMAPLHGMQSVTEKLAFELKNEILLNTTVESLEHLEAFQKNENLILSTPAPITAKLLRSVDPQSAAALDTVQYSPLVTITAFFHEKDFAHGKPRGVGVLIPRSEPFRTLGVLFSSSSFPNRTQNPQHVSLTIMLGGTTDPEALKLSDSEIQSLVEHELGQLLGLVNPALSFEITRWKQAIPVYNTALQDSHRALSAGFCKSAGRVIFSNYSRQVSIRGMIETLPNF